MKTAYIHASVYTGQLPLCEAFLVEDGKFARTGSTQEILREISESDACVDLNGAFVAP